MKRISDRTGAPAIYPLECVPLPGVARENLGNGVELVTLNHGQQPVNRIMVSWPRGTADVDNPEALHLLRAMLTEGTCRHSGAELADAFEFNGAWIRVEVGRHVTSIILHSLNNTVDEVMPLLVEMISCPSLDAGVFDGICQKEAAACELRRRKVAERATELSGRMYYGENHPMAHVVTPDLIRNVDVNSLRMLHENLMLSVRPTVYLAGAVDDGLRKRVADIMGGIVFAAGGVPVCRRIIPVPSGVGSRCETVVDESSMQTAIRLVMPAIGREHPDYEHLRYTAFALGGYFGSRLMSNIREEKGYTYGISASVSSLHEGASVSVSCEADNRYAAAVLDEIDHEIMRLADETMPSDEFAVVKSSIMSGLAAISDSPFSIMDYHQLLDMYALPSDHHSFQLEQLASLNPQVIRECAAKYLVGSPRIVALAGNPAQAAS